ncbi:MAG: mechanosensitive ion channel [Lewinellaceae bacterium]|nr:mechanosensitive ion channel [Lewinellaceae bacterium]
MHAFLLQIGNPVDRFTPYLKMFGEAMATFAPKILGALFLLFIGWLIGKGLARVIRKVLERIGADKLADRLNEIEIFSKSPVKFKPSQLFSKIVYYLIFFLFFMAATDVLGIEAVSLMIADIFNYLPRLISALFVFIIGVFLADFLKNMVQTACNSLNIPAGTLIANFVFYFLFINVAMITLSQAGIETEFIQDNLSIVLGGIVAAFAIGYGYASRPLLANILGGYYNRNRINIGDWISIENVSGEIIAIDNTTFSIATTGQGKIIIPLSKLSMEKYEIVQQNQAKQ